MKTTKTVKTAAGVELAKINRPIFDQAYQRVFKKAASEDQAANVIELVDFFKKTAGKEVLQCTECGGGAPAAQFPDHCPFCGECDEPENEDEIDEAALKDSEAEAEDEDEAEDEAEPVENQEVEEDNMTTLPSKAETGVEASNHKESDLNAAMVRIKKAKGVGASAFWSIACELRDIHVKDLWKLRNDDEGKPKYKSFAKFLSAEVDFHERTAYRMIEVANQFTADQGEKYGTSILKALLSAPKEQREQILVKLDKGQIKSQREVVKAAAKLKAEEPKQIQSKTGSGVAKASAKSAEKAAEKRKVVTIALPIGRKTIKLFACALKKDAPEKRAKKISDQPWGQFEASNGTTMYFMVKESNIGELELTIEARRDD